MGLIRRRREEPPAVWVVDDNPVDLEGSVARLRKLGLRVEEIADQSAFIERLDQVAHDSAPRLVLLDLRLPWLLGGGDPSSIDGGLGCMELLKAEAATSAVPVVIFSAFVDDPLIAERVRHEHVAAVIDKATSPERLEVVVQNLVSPNLSRKSARAKRVGRQLERRLLRWGAAAAAVTAVAALVEKFIF